MIMRPLNNIFCLISFILILILLSGCGSVHFNSLKPIKAKVKDDSLTPTLSWKMPKESGEVDLAIWEAVKKSGGRLYIPGPIVYYEKGIEGNSHKVKEPLRPNCNYLWSVKEANTHLWATTKKRPFFDFWPGFLTRAIIRVITVDMESTGFFFALVTPDSVSKTSGEM